MNIRTQRFDLAGPAGLLKAMRDTPEGEPRGVAVLAHPHPLFGGTMENKVVQTLARGAVLAGYTSVRFNFRGVAGSAGTHDDGRGEIDDLLAVLEAVAPAGPLMLGGFSFGAYVFARNQIRYALSMPMPLSLTRTVT